MPSCRGNRQACDCWSKSGYLGFNIGNPAEFSIRELAEIVIDVTGSRSKIVSRPLPADDPRQRQPDIAKARQLLGWTPRTPLKEGLVRTIAYFESLLQEEGVRAMVGGKK